MKGIVPHLWFNANAEEAVKLYTEMLPDSSIGATSRYNAESAKASGQKEGSVMTVSFQLCGQSFLAINGGPHFTFSPAASFVVNCATEEEVNAVWARLSDGGTALMPLGAYPFNKRFGWVQDKFGLSWQVLLSDRPQKIEPCLMFVGAQNGKAGEAIRLYTSLFPNSAVLNEERYAKGEPGDEGTLKRAFFQLRGQEFIAMDSSGPHQFGFTGAVSFLVNCETQEEIDSLWAAFSDGGKPEPCGWIRDRYGVYWQVTAAMIGTWMSNPKTAGPVMREMLTMQKIDIARLERAAAQR